MSIIISLFNCFVVIGFITLITYGIVKNKSTKFKLITIISIYSVLFIVYFIALLYDISKTKSFLFMNHYRNIIYLSLILIFFICMFVPNLKAHIIGKRYGYPKEKKIYKSVIHKEERVLILVKEGMNVYLPKKKDSISSLSFKVNKKEFIYQQITNYANNYNLNLDNENTKKIGVYSSNKLIIHCFICDLVEFNCSSFKIYNSLDISNIDEIDTLTKKLYIKLLIGEQFDIIDE